MQPGAGEYQGLGQLTTGCRGAGCSVVQHTPPEGLEAAGANCNARFLLQLNAARGAAVDVRREGQAGALSLIRYLQPSSYCWVRGWLWRQFDFDLHRLALGDFPDDHRSGWASVKRSVSLRSPFGSGRRIQHCKNPSSEFERKGDWYMGHGYGRESRA